MTLSVWITVVVTAREVLAYVGSLLNQKWITAFSYDEITPAQTFSKKTSQLFDQSLKFFSFSSLSVGYTLHS